MQIRVLIFEEKVLRPRVGTKETEGREPDAIDEEAPVILAGFGRFGNFVGRLLRSQKVDVTVIDSDPDHVDFLRRVGIILSRCVSMVHESSLFYFLQCSMVRIGSAPAEELAPGCREKATNRSIMSPPSKLRNRHYQLFRPFHPAI